MRLFIFVFFFFFSSRRRHTRSYGDWSSDVCSSDLFHGNARTAPSGPPRRSSARAAALRSEERRVGKECRSRWSPDHYKKKKQTHVIYSQLCHYRAHEYQARYVDGIVILTLTVCIIV